MYIRRDTKKSQAKPKGKGRVPKGTTYLSIAHNVKEDSLKGKGAKPIVFANLGPEDERKGEKASSNAKAFERYADKRLGEKPTKAKVAKVAAETRQAGPVVSKELGMRLLLSVPWRAFGIGPALLAFEKRHRSEFPRTARAVSSSSTTNSTRPPTPPKGTTGASGSARRPKAFRSYCGAGPPSTTERLWRR